ncbi:MAG TPA: hypothetical protein VLS90_16040, partial [Thermodesulfobacteriota bacterium]|nr:hypothetical protein [Thermodesulfobacteriota bacterium]
AIFVIHCLACAFTWGRQTACRFILGQLFAIAAILVLVVIVSNTRIIPSIPPSTFWVELFGRGYLQFLILASGVAVSVKAGGTLIGLAVKPFTDELQREQERAKYNEACAARGFENGGKIIGYLERALIFFFILTGQPGSIGFLIAAKSILRFGEVKDRQNRLEAEYIIIGTLMSFGYGMLTAYLTQFFLGKI